MLPSRCTRSSLQLLSDSSLLAPNALRSSIPRIAYFSTTPILPGAVLTKKRKGPLVPTKRGSPTSFNPRQKKGVVASSKRPAPGERKALRKRIVLSNNNALAVSSLVDLNEVNALSKENAGKVMGLPEEALDVLRTVGAFKPTQAWALFRRPAVLMRQETMRLVDLFTEVELSAGTQEEMKTLRRILSGERKAGKSILLLQSLVMALLRNWFIINIPEGRDITNSNTEYAPLEGSNPVQYTQDTYTANLLGQILKANSSFLKSTKMVTNPDLPVPLVGNGTLEDLVLLGADNPDASWPVFLALWEELSQPGRPPIFFAIDGLSHIMTETAYLAPNLKRIHPFDFTLAKHFVDHLSGGRKLPNGGIVLAATARSDAPVSPALDICISVAQALQKTPENLPEWSPYQKLDTRVMEALKALHDKNSDLDVIHVGGLSKEEARSIMEYYAESGLLRREVNDVLVGEKWSVAGMGNVGELERATVRSRM